MDFTYHWGMGDGHLQQFSGWRDQTGQGLLAGRYPLRLVGQSPPGPGEKTLGVVVVASLVKDLDLEGVSSLLPQMQMVE